VGYGRSVNYEGKKLGFFDENFLVAFSKFTTLERRGGLGGLGQKGNGRSGAREEASLAAVRLCESGVQWKKDLVFGESAHEETGR